MKRPMQPRWYRWRTTHSHGPSYWRYEHTTLAELKPTAQIESDGIHSPDIERIKVPPLEWLAARRSSTIDRINELTAYADFLRMELAKHYPGHRVA